MRLYGGGNGLRRGWGLGGVLAWATPTHTRRLIINSVRQLGMCVTPEPEPEPLPIGLAWPGLVVLLLANLHGCLIKAAKEAL